MKRSRSTNDDGELPYVEQDIVEEILTRLPPSSLMRFKRVSTSFKNLISEKRFCNSHLEHSLEHNCLQLMNLDGVDTTLVYDYRTGRTVWDDESEASKYAFLAECNGLFCVGSGDDILLINPSTKKATTVPSSEIGFPSLYGDALAFFGLGYNSAEEDYKLVRITTFEGAEFTNEVQIFSRNTGTWNRVNDFPYEYLFPYPGVFANGRIHWVVSMWNDEARDRRRNVVALNLRDYSYILIQIPFPEIKMSHIDICNLGEKLVVFQHPSHNASDIWILNHESGSQPWTRIEVQTNYPTRWHENNYFRPLCMLKNGEILIRVASKKLIRFDVAKNCCSDGYTPPLPLDCKVISYVESIVSPYGT